MEHRWLDDLLASLARRPPEPAPCTLLYWRVYETTAERVYLGVAPLGVVDGYPTRWEAVIAAYRMSRDACRLGRPERYLVGAEVEEVADPLAGRVLR